MFQKKGWLINQPFFVSRRDMWCLQCAPVKYATLRFTKLVFVIGGGYQRDINALVDVHLQLFRAAGIIG